MTSEPRTRRGAALAVGSLLTLAACGAAAPEHTGRLRYTPAPQTMSVEAYLGDGIRLETPEGELVLAASETVPEGRLAEAAGRRVRLRCTARPATPPDPREAAPLGPDGRPMARPAKCAVTELTILGE